MTLFQTNAGRGAWFSRSGTAVLGAAARRGGDLYGRFYDDRYPPNGVVRGATIDLMPDKGGARLGRQTTDSRGDFRFKANAAIPPGKYRLQTMVNGALQSVKVALFEEDTCHDLHVTSAAALAGI